VQSIPQHRAPNAEDIKSSISPLEFYRGAIPAKSTAIGHGWVGGGLCPFHDDNNPGSYRVNLDTGAYWCFSCGASGGDIIAYTMAIQDCRFTAALRLLADDWGVSR
jgi:DNA primase